MAIAFLPIEIDVRLPDEDKLLAFCERYKLPKIKGNDDNVEYWDLIPVISRVPHDKWSDMQYVKNVLHNRYNPNMGECVYANNIDVEFPEIPYMLNQLPFKELTMVVMMMQKEYVPHHLDPHLGDIINDPYEISIMNEPHRYNIQLTQFNKDAFFVSEVRNGQKIFPKITKDKPCFAFCERYHFHGSEYVGPNKIQLSIFGIVDREKHHAVITKNLMKYRNEAIIFEDPIDLWDPKYHHDKY